MKRKCHLVINNYARGGKSKHKIFEPFLLSKNVAFCLLLRTTRVSTSNIKLHLLTNLKFEVETLNTEI